MIVDSFARGAQYTLGSLWNAFYPELLKLLAQGDSLPDGGYPLAGGPENGGVMAFVSSYEAKEESEARYEGHDRMADIQTILSGDEYMDVFFLRGGEKESLHDEQRDLIFYDEAPEAFTRVHLKPGVFALVLPGEAHRPCVKCASEKVRKLVVKVPVKALNAPSSL